LLEPYAWLVWLELACKLLGLLANLYELDCLVRLGLLAWLKSACLFPSLIQSPIQSTT